jgi:serine protease
VAKGASIYSLQVVTCDTLDGTFNAIMKAFNRVIALQQAGNRGPAVVNFPAIGSYSFSANQKEHIARKISELTDVYDIPVVISAGGDPANNDPALSAPACTSAAGATAPNALVIGAAQVTDAISRYSAWGPCVALFAPGGTLYDERGGFAPDPSYSVTSATLNYPADAFTFFGGTSSAAAFVTGAIARYLQSHPTATVSEVNQAIRDNVTLDVVTFDTPYQQTTNNNMLYIPPEW